MTDSLAVCSFKYNSRIKLNTVDSVLSIVLLQGCNDGRVRIGTRSTSNHFFVRLVLLQTEVLTELVESTKTLTTRRLNTFDFDLSQGLWNLTSSHLGSNAFHSVGKHLEQVLAGIFLGGWVSVVPNTHWSKVVVFLGETEFRQEAQHGSSMFHLGLLDGGFVTFSFGGSQLERKLLADLQVLVDGERLKPFSVFLTDTTVPAHVPVRSILWSLLIWSNGVGTLDVNIQNSQKSGTQVRQFFQH